MSTLKVNTIQTNTGSGVDIDSPLDSINVTNSATIGGNLQVNNILPSVGTNVAIGTAGGSVTLTGSVTGSSIINTGVTTVSAGSTSAPSISPTGDSNTGIFFPSADTIAFAEGGVESLRVDSSGNFGVGTNNPTQRLDVRGQVFSATSANSDQNLRYRSSDTNWHGTINQSVSGGTIANTVGVGGRWDVNGTTYNCTKDFNGSFPSAAISIQSQYNSSNGARFAFLSKAAGSTTTDGTVTELAVINSTGLVLPAGAGIDFSATANSSGTMSSELLADYEEGSWTPRISGTSGGNYTPGADNVGRYTKIGRIVTASATIHWTAAPTPYSGIVTITGLPYSSLNVSSYRAAGIIPGQATGIYSDATYPVLAAAMDANQSLVYVIKKSDLITSGTNYSHTPAVNSGGNIYGFTITYVTN
jgi:hypothetical protein